MLFDEFKYSNEEVSDQNIVALILLTFSFKYSWHIIAILRSSRPGMSCEKDVLKSFTKFIGKQLCRSLFFHKDAGRLEKILRHMCFPMKFAKFLKLSLLKNTSGRLLLDMQA